MMKKIHIVFLLLFIVGLAFFLVNSENYIGGKSFFIENENSENIVSSEDYTEEEVVEEEEIGDKSVLTGTVCENYNRRPLAVMLSGDTEARNLSGLSSADIVFEMPVVTGGITRYMAIFGCEDPEEIGSIRSARHDFIPLAAGFGAIYVHWGGSHFALDKLDNHIIDNINALYLDGTVFYRKSGIVSPHDGFSSTEKLREYAESVDYISDWNFSGYKFSSKEKSVISKGRLSIGYPSAFKVEYEYDSETDKYYRFKSGTREIDENTGEQVSTTNVVIMYADSRQIEGQYNDVDIEGENKAVFYYAGQEIVGTWKKNKDDISSKLYFFDDSNREIEFNPGKIWIQVVDPSQDVDWIASF